MNIFALFQVFLFVTIVGLLWVILGSTSEDQDPEEEEIFPEPSWEDLDPGIRAVVHRLWSAGFQTTDSGDGKTKPADECTLSVPHVFMICDLDVGTEEVHRLWNVVESWRIPGFPDLPEDLSVEVGYSPQDQVCVLSLIGVDDSMLPPVEFS